LPRLRVCLCFHEPSPCGERACGYVCICTPRRRAFVCVFTAVRCVVARACLRRSRTPPSYPRRLRTTTVHAAAPVLYPALVQCCDVAIRDTIGTGGFAKVKMAKHKLTGAKVRVPCLLVSALFPTMHIAGRHQDHGENSPQANCMVVLVCRACRF
jgi:hypothetical protein